MAPPDAPNSSHTAGTREEPADLSCLEILKKRRDFLAAAKARRAPVPGFLIQARKRNDGEAGAGIRVGFTCSKKIGNAVTRNRAKRRLRALAREVLPKHGRAGWDYVLIGKPGVTVVREFDALRDDMFQALRKLHPDAPPTA